jgi:hypothetical protein
MEYMAILEDQFNSYYPKPIIINAINISEAEEKANKYCEELEEQDEYYNARFTLSYIVAFDKVARIS